MRPEQATFSSSPAGPSQRERWEMSHEDAGRHGQTRSRSFGLANKSGSDCSVYRPRSNHNEGDRNGRRNSTAKSASTGSSTRCQRRTNKDDARAPLFEFARALARRQFFTDNPDIEPEMLNDDGSNDSRGDLRAVFQR